MTPMRPGTGKTGPSPKVPGLGSMPSGGSAYGGGGMGPMGRPGLPPTMRPPGMAPGGMPGGMPGPMIKPGMPGMAQSGGGNPALMQLLARMKAGGGAPGMQPGMAPGMAPTQPEWGDPGAMNPGMQSQALAQALRRPLGVPY